MLELYQSTAYADQNPSWHEEDAPWKASKITEILRKNAVAFDTLCEVGCGTGEILLSLETSFPFSRAAGFEISNHAYMRAKRKETPRTTFHLADPAETGARFDVLLAIDVMEHVEDYISFLKRIRPVAHHKVLHIPLDLSVQSLLRQWPIMKLRRDVGHLHYFFKESAIATLKDCGYNIIDYAYTASRIELPSQALSSRAMILPRRLLFRINPDFAVRVLGGYSLLVLAK